MATLDQAAAGRAMRLLSGANHDAGVLGQHIPAAMLFVPSRGGISHTPDEHTDPAPIDAAADVLTAALARLIESPTP
ncbi:MAG: M20/M25/M40 family metallo-hydrolase [Rhodobacterales bacterium]|nr:M20/M25/M40 family metallo-hydrolase [Rhodobacterales bacterium]MDX5499650.1 M20/M25/M40 family metallo-hydrolase [Rhodobacterales bacterium]